MDGMTERTALLLGEDGVERLKKPMCCCLAWAVWAAMRPRPWPGPGWAA